MIFVNFDLENIKRLADSSKRRAKSEKQNSIRTKFFEWLNQIFASRYFRPIA